MAFIPNVFSASLALFAAGAAFGATYTCPTVDPPTPLPGAVVLETWKDAKGGIWSLTCTNSSRSGDFIWEYQANALAAKKQIGKCVYVGGRNRTYEDVDPTTKNVSQWRHTCFNPTPTADGKFCAILDVFDKEACRTTRRYLKYDPNAATPTWQEASLRRDTDAAAYAAFSDADLDGDSIADEGFNWLSSDLYGASDPDLPAEYSNRTTLEVAFMGGLNVITWDVGQINPALTPGDNVLFSDLNSGMLVGVDPRFSVMDTTEGLMFTAMTNIPLLTGEQLAVFGDAGPSGLETRWAVEDLGAAEYWSAIFDDPRTLDEIGFSNNLDFSDSPGYASAYGNLRIVPAPGAALLGLGVAIMGAAARRRKAG